MRYRCTSIATSKVGAAIASVTVPLEDQLVAALAEESFGDAFDQFSVIVIALDRPDKRFEHRHHRVTRLKDPRTGETVRLLSMAVVMDAGEVEGLTRDELRSRIIEGLFARLDSPGLKIPKIFNYPAFVTAVKQALSLRH